MAATTAAAASSFIGTRLPDLHSGSGRVQARFGFGAKKSPPKKASKNIPDRPLWFPGAKAPEYLDGSLVGDYGFDPFGLGKPAEYLQYDFDSLDQNLAKNLAGDVIGTRFESADVNPTPFQPYTEVFGLQRFRECELIHGRWAMLATLGALAVESLTGITWQDAGKVELIEGSSYLGQPLPFSITTLIWIEVLVIGYIEFQRNAELDPEKRLYPGGKFFDPLGLAADPEKKATLQLAEIKHARLAMVGFLGFAVQAAVTGKGPLNNWATNSNSSLLVGPLIAKQYKFSTLKMDLNQNGTLFSCNAEPRKNNNLGDTTLRLDCFGYGGNTAAGFGRARTNLGDRASDDGCRLVLGLGPTPRIYSNDYYPIEVNKNKGASSILHQELSSEGDSILKLGLSGGTEVVGAVLEYSVSSQTDLNASHHPDQVAIVGNRLKVPIADEGSTSAKRSGGYMPSLLFAPRMDNNKLFWQSQEYLEPATKSHSHPSQLSSEPSAISDYSVCTDSELATAGTPSNYQTSNAKKCKFAGCTKGARGATGLCIGHGGGQRCQKPGCNKGAESRTAYCKAHGGGRRCQHLGCTKSAEGRTDYCIAHGGGRRCGYPAGCSKAARGKSGLCIKHGGGKRCKVEGCTRSAEGQVGLCISHGGGRRCQFQGCNKGAQGSTMYCKAHGGGKRCIFAGCTKGAEGSTPLCKGHGGGKRCLFDGGGICPKSVHGGTNFCVAHGGGKRCAVPGCTKSARGRTDCCVRHGGGKRCKFENCGKSAQGSTDFCKAHGGGKRCNWGEGKCEKFARGRSGLCVAHSSMAQERDSNKKGMIGPGLFHGLVLAGSTAGSSYENTYSSSGASELSDSIDSLENPAKRQHLIPPQVLVPLSMKSSSSYTRPLSSEKQGEGSIRGCTAGGTSSGSMRKNLEFVVPEGRVHGGGLLSLLGGDLKNAIDGI